MTGSSSRTASPWSTKQGAGRGFGTWSMKLLGENLLGGELGFESGPQGTRFELRLPSQ